MKKAIKSFGAIATAALMLLPICACGSKNKDDEEGDGSTITIYAGGSSEFMWSKGTKEDEVIAYIENKYYQDTGSKIKFDVHLDSGKNMKTIISKEISEGKADIIISHTSGGDGIDDYMVNNNVYANLRNALISRDMLDSGYFEMTVGSGANQKTFNGLNRLTTQDSQIIGIPSMINPYKFGILVRKDWMNACGYTDDPALAGQYTLVDNFQTFTQMAEAMKTHIGRTGKTDYVMTGAMFDLEKAGLIGAHGLKAGYWTNTVYNNLVGPGYINPGYCDVLKLEYDWKDKGIIAKDCDNILINEGESDFLSGKTGIFVQDPTITHLISMARRTKALHPEAEFTVLGALTKDANSTEKGFMRNSVGTFAACISRNSSKVNKIIAFLDWCYSSKENYLLCRYGREGIDWNYDEEKGTYGYNSDAEYVNPPYSGILTLVENQAIADLTYDGYTEEELGWIRTARDPSNYLDNDTIDYLMLTTRKDMQNQRDTAASYAGADIRKIWGMNVQRSEIDGTFSNMQSSYMKNANGYMTMMYELYTDLVNRHGSSN